MGSACKFLIRVKLELDKQYQLFKYSVFLKDNLSSRVHTQAFPLLTVPYRNAVVWLLRQSISLFVLLWQNTYVWIIYQEKSFTCCHICCVCSSQRAWMTRVAEMHLEEIIWQAKGQESRLAVHTCGTSTREMEAELGIQSQPWPHRVWGQPGPHGKQDEMKQVQLHSFCDNARSNQH